MQRHRLLTLAAAPLIAGCTDATRTVAPADGALAAAVTLAIPADISGNWAETREDFIHLTDLAVSSASLPRGSARRSAAAPKGG